MNKKLMAFSLVIGLGFSQMPMQAAFFSEAGISKAGASWFMNLVRENPIKSLAIVGGIAGLAYLAYKYKTTEQKEESSVEQNNAFNVVKNKDQVRQEIATAYQKRVTDLINKVTKRNKVKSNNVWRSDNICNYYGNYYMEIRYGNGTCTVTIQDRYSGRKLGAQGIDIDTDKKKKEDMVNEIITVIVDILSKG